MCLFNSRSNATADYLSTPDLSLCSTEAWSEHGKETTLSGEEPLHCMQSYAQLARDYARDYAGNRFRNNVFIHYVFSGAITDKLYPLKISQIPRNISFKIIGRPKIIPALILTPKVSSRFQVSNNTTAMKPQIEINLGTSFDWYKK